MMQLFGRLFTFSSFEGKSFHFPFKASILKLEDMKFESCMSTRNPQTPGRKPGVTCTEFQLHKSQLNTNVKRNLFDYTEFRLKLYIAQIKDEQQKITLENVLLSYKKGLVAVAWRSGKPVWITVTKETKR